MTPADFLQAPWLNSLLTVIWSVISVFIKLLLLPLDLLLTNFIPQFSHLTTIVSDFFNLSLTYISWLIDACGIPPIVLSLALAYATFATTATLTMWGIKLVAQWKKAIL